MQSNELKLLTIEQRASVKQQVFLDVACDGILDNLVRRAAQAANMPMATLSFFDSAMDSANNSDALAREHFKSCHGIALHSLPLEISLFYTGANPCPPLVLLPEIPANSRFTNHPLIAGAPYIRSYFGAAVTCNKFVVGALSVYDSVVRQITSRESEALVNLASMVSARLDARSSNAATGPVLAANEHSASPELMHAMERLDLALAASGLAVWDWDLVANKIYFSAHWGKLIGRHGAEALFTNKEVLSWLHKEDREKFIIGMQNAITGTTNEFDCEYRVKNEPGEWVWIYSQGMVTQRGTSGLATRMNGTCANITKRKTVEARAEFLATRDPLTGLPNRALLNDRLEQGIANAARKHSRLAFMFIDLDRFKTINDSLGHDVGDELLKTVATRLLGCVRASDTVARLGGDEFAVIIENLPDAENEGAQYVAEKMIAAMASPVLINGHTLTTSCSIGIGVYPDDGNDSQTLMKHADVAMYDAKNKGRNNYQFFSHALNARAQERLSIENYLRLALRRNELVLYYQPRVSFATGNITAVEALIRWHHPRHGLLTPDKFISVAEDSGLIVPMGEWVLVNAFSQLFAWQKQFDYPLKLALNLSAAQLLDGDRLIRSVQQALTMTSLGAKQVEFELTEGMLQKNAEEVTGLLNHLGALGFGLIIDDFGTGYSSLSSLKRLPVSHIKVDGSFVRDIGVDANDEAVISAMIAMTHSLKLSVIAEGVENEQQFNALRELKCDEFQGYYFARPMTTAEFEQFYVASTITRSNG